MKIKKLILDVKTGKITEEEIDFRPEIIVDKEKLKKKVDEFTEQYIIQKIEELDEDFTDLTSELAIYLTKAELSDYERARKDFIEKLLKNYLLGRRKFGRLRNR